MNIKTECLTYLNDEEKLIIKVFPKFINVTEEFFKNVYEVINCDFSGISENKVYRHFLKILKDTVILFFENDAPKSYMQRCFSVLNGCESIEYFKIIMKTKSNEVKFVLNYLLKTFIHWQSPDITKENKLNELISFIDGHM